jgi:hypothetical protein
MLPQTANAEVGELAKLVASLFVLRPLPRAARRQELVRDMRRQAIVRDLLSDRDSWKEAGRQLRRDFPEVAALAPEFLGDLLVEKQRPQPRPVPVRSTSGADGGGSGGRGGGWIVFVVIMVVVNVIRLAFNGSGGSSHTPPFIAPTFSERPFRLDDPEMKKLIDGAQKKTDEDLDKELERFKRMSSKPSRSPSPP